MRIQDNFDYNKQYFEEYYSKKLNLEKRLITINEKYNKSSSFIQDETYCAAYLYNNFIRKNNKDN